ncbi:MAG TPA: hypothetical protein VK212_11180 [Lentimicrobium sp.]|nr:hypothetical protein [Lentimicrobium sp.]
MKRFLIEVPHGADKKACNEAIQVFLATGSHFLTHADWGCEDGEHKAWIIVDVDNKEEAKMILPSLFRSSAKITQLRHYTPEDLKEPDNVHK